MARESPDNPYAPPTDDDRDDAPPSSGPPRRFSPASLGQRFGGAFIDGIVNLTIGYAVHSAFRGEAIGFSDMFGAGALRRSAGETAVATALPLILLGTLVAMRGQSVGKIVMLTRIVDAEGRQAGLTNGFLLRTLPITAIALIPTFVLMAGASAQDILPLTTITGLFSLVDIGLIFGADRRCLHDRIAGTFVAVVGSERPERPRKKKKKRKKPAPAADE